MSIAETSGDFIYEDEKVKQYWNEFLKKLYRRK